MLIKHLKYGQLRALIENTTEIPQKIKNRTGIYDPTIPLLEIHPKETKALTQKDICIPMFIVALLQ